MVALPKAGPPTAATDALRERARCHRKALRARTGYEEATVHSYESAIAAAVLDKRGPLTEEEVLKVVQNFPDPLADLSKI